MSVGLEGEGQREEQRDGGEYKSWGFFTSGLSSTDNHSDLPTGLQNNRKARTIQTQDIIMKLIFLFTFLINLAAARETINLDDRAVKLPRKQTYRPGKIDGDYISLPLSRSENGPAEYKTSTDKTTLVRPAVTLKKLPDQYIDAGLSKRRESFQALKQLRRQVSAADFFECYNSSPTPSPSDCQTLTTQVLSSNQDLIVTANACLLFTYRSCQAFFCSLCTTISTSTDFIGNQLDTLEALCVENGQIGTIVGEGSDGWDVGFVSPGSGLPSYDVC
ncbi:hypothetical protein SMACR_08714 [Sordaria macrospora]|nr:hypothetical protein SMACR_08714 [Sordaria macrospora]WPJ65097.1 hypothetical protein SMAC4_08714 [Sordaria macrospora]